MIVVTSGDDADCAGCIDAENEFVDQSSAQRIFLFSSHKFQSSKTITVIIVFG